MTKLIELSPVYKAQVLARNLEHATKELQDFLEPYRQKFAAFRYEIAPVTCKYTRPELATDYVGRDNEFFSFKGEPEYIDGLDIDPFLDLPNEFIEDPEGYMARQFAIQSDAEAKRLKNEIARSQLKVDATQTALDRENEALAAAKAKLGALTILASQQKDKK